MYSLSAVLHLQVLNFANVGVAVSSNGQALHMPTSSLHFLSALTAVFVVDAIAAQTWCQLADHWAATVHH